ncbi:hypothetical protein L7F22_053641, partial [Adiantum nelumboides]|nr:hypothetical protein [Adiantum nelumboides]
MSLLAISLFAEQGGEAASFSKNKGRTHLWKPRMGDGIPKAARDLTPEATVVTFTLKAIAIKNGQSVVVIVEVVEEDVARAAAAGGNPG